MNLETQYPPSNRGLIVVWGLLGAMPFGGMIWQVLHYLVGFRRLGFDVWYVEDSLTPCLNPQSWDQRADFETTAQFLNSTLERVGLADRWVFRPYEDVSLGALDVDGLLDLYRNADAVFNLCSSVRPRQEHLEIRNLVLLQTDPVSPQIRMANGNDGLIERISKHHFHFTYGENIGRPGNPVPVMNFEWLPTRAPVILDWWTTDVLPGSDSSFSTISSWTSKSGHVDWGGDRYYWQKSMEFEKILDLPRMVSAPLELSLANATQEDAERLHLRGWRVKSSAALSDPEKYRSYVRKSMGELTVAKDQYVRLRSGWFSDRSACYLASGRPVVTQDTGFSSVIPTGEGLFSFQNADDAAAALDEIMSSYARHARAALDLAREYFAAEKVLADVARRVGLL